MRVENSFITLVDNMDNSSLCVCAYYVCVCVRGIRYESEMESKFGGHYIRIIHYLIMINYYRINPASIDQYILF